MTKSLVKLGIRAKCTLAKLSLGVEISFLLGVQGFQRLGSHSFEVDSVADFLSLLHTQLDSLLRIVSKFMLLL